jgi:uncharacterized protein
MRWLVEVPFLFYRFFLSPALHLLVGAQAGCRFQPTCSQYGERALKAHGPLRGGLLMVARICRCHPFSPGGIDPVPRYDIASTRKVSANGS